MPYSESILHTLLNSSGLWLRFTHQQIIISGFPGSYTENSLHDNVRSESGLRQGIGFMRWNRYDLCISSSLQELPPADARFSVGVFFSLCSNSFWKQIQNFIGSVRDHVFLGIIQKIRGSRGESGKTGIQFFRVSDFGNVQNNALIGTWGSLPTINGILSASKPKLA